MTPVSPPTSRGSGTLGPPDHSDVLVFPPVVPATGFLAGVLLQVLRPIAIAAPAAGRMRLTGIPVLLAGAAGFVWMVITMKQARTPIHNARTPTALVVHGPFRFTRNPMYVFGSIGYAGLALILVQPWSLALLPVVLVVLHYAVVVREERFLERKFGDAYTHYRRQVRRWI